jgi:tetratricopeptide (TPR) repeat protein
MKLRTRLGAEEVIPAARIVEIQTTWTPPHEAARAARSEGRFDDAIALFREAKGAETRPWALRQVAADLSGCCLDAGRIEPAVNEFLAILAADPATRHFAVIPVAWRSTPDDPVLEARAAAWLALRRVPAASLLGASWLLATPRRGEAVAALEELQKSSDARVAGLAAIQLWRTKLVAASLDEARRWHAQLEKMPLEVQAAGWYVLGQVYARLDQPQQAALAWLKIPLLFRQQRALAADALLAAGGQLEKMMQPQEAAGVYRELVRDFPQLSATAEAQKRLAKLGL